MKPSPHAEPGTIRISFQIPEDRWAEFEKLTVKQAVAQVLGVRVTLPKERTLPSYTTHNTHGKLGKGTPCSVRRTSNGCIEVQVQAKDLYKVGAAGLPDSMPLVYMGKPWYIHGREEPKGRRPF